jgi:hypothetical protein
VPAGGQAGIRWTAGATRPAVVGGVLTATAAADLSAVDLAWDARRLSQTGVNLVEAAGSGDYGCAAVPRERQFILPR